MPTKVVATLSCNVTYSMGNILILHTLHEYLSATNSLIKFVFYHYPSIFFHNLTLLISYLHKSFNATYSSFNIACVILNYVYNFIHEHCNLLYSMLNIVMQHTYSCLSHFDIHFPECQNGANSFLYLSLRCRLIS